MDFPTILRVLPGAWLLLGMPRALLGADYRDDIGYVKLAAELGAAVPNGAGVSVSQIEAPESTDTFQPDTGNAEFTGKAFTIKSSPSVSSSGHATAVAQYFYGSVTSMASGVQTIDLYNANGWLQSDLLHYGLGTAPAAENRDIENHSWIGSTNNSSADQEILRRLDYAIQQSDFVAVVGLNNAANTTVPPLLGSSYNAIAVGLSNGNHSTGSTTLDGIGRLKPEIVSPNPLVSFATPQVGAAAALLIQKIRSDALFAAADHSVVVKALLLSGATKTQFPGWNRTSTQPLDAHFGAGQVNIYRSYYDLVAGQQAAGTSASVKTRGWDYRTTSTTSRKYFFDIPAGNTAPGLSVVLSWNRAITVSTYTSTLANLDLKLSSASGFTVGTAVDASVSTVDNVEHIYQPNLPPGRYVLEVSSPTANIKYGLAWNTVPNVQVSASGPVASESGLAPGSFTFTRTGETTNALTASFTISGTASNGSDYQALANSITFAAGEASKTINVSPKSDSLAEGDETVTLTLAADLAYGLDTAISATVTVRDLPFDAWRFSHFTTDQLADAAFSGSAGDPDADGISNLVEYGLNLDPVTASRDGLPTVSQINGMTTFSFLRVKNATDLTYLPQVSTDLQDWHDGPDYLTESAIIDNGATETVRVVPVATVPAQFFRLKITR